MANIQQQPEKNLYGKEYIKLRLYTFILLSDPIALE